MLRNSYFRHQLSTLKFFCRFSSAQSSVGVDVSLTSPEDVKKFLSDKKIASEQGYTCLSYVCPSVPKSRAKTVDENNKVFVNTRTGAYICNYCQQAGDYGSFKSLLNSLAHSNSEKSSITKRCLRTMGSSTIDPQQNDIFTGSKRIALLSPEEFSTFCNQLNFEKLLDQSTFSSYDCYTAYPGLDSVTFPYNGPANNAQLRLRGVRTLNLQPTQNSAGFEHVVSRMNQLAPSNIYGLFGWHLLSKRTTEIVLTANELDALAIYQSLSHSPSSSTAVLSLPCGYHSLPQYILPLLESCKKLTLWLGSELAVWQAAKQFSRKLGEKRCHLVRPNDQYGGAFDAMAKGNDLKSIVATAHPAVHRAIVSFSQLRQDVFAELSQSEQVAGVRWKKYPRLNDILKGHRRGELTVFTGPTGAGKTTFISDYSLDLAMQGVATLWGSFEISNVRLCKLMLTQFAGRKLAPSNELKDDFCILGDQFEQLPINFLTFHGSESLRRVIDAMTHAVYVHDIAHVVIDNLQFMMDVESDRTMVDRFQKQDQIIAALRRFATQQQCHVTLVIHPRKEADGQPLTNSSIFGGVKAVQEADNVMILQPSVSMSPAGGFFGGVNSGGGGYSSNQFRNNQAGQGSLGSTFNNFNANTKCVQVTKNRFDGELGRLNLRFNRESLTFEQVGGTSAAKQQQQQQPTYSSQDLPKKPLSAIFSKSENVSVPSRGKRSDAMDEDEEDEVVSLSKTYASASASVDAILADLENK